MNLITVFSWLSLAFGLAFILFAIAVLGTPPLDIGMASTAAVFLLFGIFGLLLVRAKGAEAR